MDNNMRDYDIQITITQRGRFGVLLTNEDNHIDYEEEFEEVEKLTIKELLKSIDRYYQYNKEEREDI